MQGANRDISAVYWIPRVTPGARPAHEQAARQQGLTGYQLQRLGRDGRLEPLPAVTGQEVLPIYYAVPRGSERRLWGLDVTSLPALRTSLAEAIDTGRPTVTEPLDWGAESPPRMVFLVLRAIYTATATGLSPDERRDKLLGLLAFAIRADAVLAEPLAAFPRGIDVHLFGETEPGGRRFACMYDSETARVEFSPLPPDEDAVELSEPLEPITLDVPGHRWALECQPSAAYFDSRHSLLPPVSLCFGLLLTGLLTTYANTLLGRTAKIERLVEQRTTELDYERFLLNTLLRYAPDFIYFKDTDGRFLRISAALAQRFGLQDPHAAEGQTDFEFYDPARAERFQADEQQVMKSGQPLLDKEEEQSGADGSYRCVSTSKVPLRNSAGLVVGTFGISRDITTRKRAEQAMREARDAAEAASRAKSDFLANMSHEIRTPLNAVIGMTELVLETELTGPQREYLKMVLESGESLLSVINDILDFSKIEAGKLSLQPAEFDLREDLGDALKSLAFRAHRKGLELACAVQPDVPERLVGDLGRLRQILVNLVGNAIKFTDAGEVVVRGPVRPRTRATRRSCTSPSATRGSGSPPTNTRRSSRPLSRSICR